MTAAVYRNTPSLSLPETQNTAPVLEFNCLYTHDIRRKSKRWQDGFLRYHTFNKRVMVYDTPRNFIGDTHWTDGEALREGDELTLDKDGVLVQVADAVGRTETDLTDLRKSKKKGNSQHGSSPIAPTRTPQTPLARALGSTAARAAPTQLKHKSLNALLGTPKGPIGKAALPARSPFEARYADSGNEENAEWEQGRPPKRQRVETAPASKHNMVTPLWARTSDAMKERRQPARPSRPICPEPEVIHISDEEPESERFLAGFSSDVLAPTSSPARETPKTTKPASLTRLSSPAFQTQKAAQRTADYPGQTRELTALGKHPKKPPHEDRDTNTWTSSTTSHAPPAKTQAALSAARKNSSRHPTAPERPTGSATGKTLRIGSSAPKKKLLLCQEQLTSMPKRISSTSTEAAAELLLDAASDDEDREQVPAKEVKTQRQLLQERLARIRMKEAKPRSGPGYVDKEVRADEGGREVGGRGRFHAVNSPSEPDWPALKSNSTTAEELAELDSMIVPEKRTEIQIENETAVTDEVVEDTEKARASSPVVQWEDKAIDRAGDSASFLTASEMDSALSVSEKQRQEKRSSAARKKVGVGRKEIRASAEACLQDQGRERQESLCDEDRLPSKVSVPSGVARNADGPAITEELNQGDTNRSRSQGRRTERPHQRVISNTDNIAATKPKRTPGAPMRFTPSPSKQKAPPEQPAQAEQPQAPAQQITRGAVPPSKAQPPFKKPTRNQVQRTVSSHTTASGAAAVVLGRSFQPPAPPALDESVDVDVPPAANPWSREAFDLFEWRPPCWDEERWCFKEMAEAVEAASK